MTNCNLRRGDSIQVHYDFVKFEHGIFLEYSFLGEPADLECYLVYEMMHEHHSDKTNETIKYVPIDSIIQVRRTMSD